MFLAVFLPLFAALYIGLSVLFQKNVRGWAIGCTVLAFSSVKMSAMVMKTAFQAKVFSSFLMPFLTWEGVPYAWRLHFDRAELFLAVLIVFSGLICLVFSKNSLSADTRNRFVCYMLSLVFSALLCLGAKNMFQFIAGWDLSVLFSFLLLTLYYQKSSVKKGGVHFLIVHKLTDVPLLCAFFMLWQKTGSLFIPPFINQQDISFSQHEAVLFSVCVLLAVSAKMVYLGAHVFLKECAEMPAPALAFSFPVVLGSLGIYLLYHCYPFMTAVPGIQGFFVYFGLATAFCALLVALNLTGVKAVLCFLMMSQFGLVISAFGLAGRMVALYTFAAVVIPVIGLFLCAGSIIYSLWGEDDILKMGGLKKQKPYTFWMMWGLCFCCAGFPFIGTFGAHQDLYAAVFLKGNSALTFLFSSLFVLCALMLSRLMFYIFYAFPKIPAEIAIKIRQVSLSMAFPLAVLITSSLFQDTLLEQSILPPLSKSQSYKILGASLMGCAGFAVGFFFFLRREKKKTAWSGFMRRFSQFCAKGFYVQEIYTTLLIKPCRIAAEKLWLYADMGMIEHWGGSFVQKIVRQASDNLQKAHTGKLHDALIWCVAGLFVFVLSVIAVQAGR